MGPQWLWNNNNNNNNNNKTCRAPWRLKIQRHWWSYVTCHTRRWNSEFSDDVWKSTASRTTWRWTVNCSRQWAQPQRRRVLPVQFVFVVQSTVERRRTAAILSVVHAKCCGADPCCHGNEILANVGNFFTKLPISRLVYQIDRVCLGLPREPTRGVDLWRHGNDIGKHGKVQDCAH